MGMKFLLLVWDGICAVDGLEAKSRRIRPYERSPGITDALYHQTLETLCSLIEKGERIAPYLREVNRQFDNISRHEQKEKPRIGVVGEIYVRSQTFSNNFLIRRLEELGCEVALPSIAEWFFYTNFTRMRNCKWFGEHRRVLFTTLFNRYMRWRQNTMYRLLGLSPETDVKTLLCHAQSYLHPSFEGEAIVTLGKTLEFMHERFSGVVNVLPFTCMPGNIVATLYKKIKDDYPDFPLFTLSVDGLDHAVNAMRLETFVSQAKNYKTS
jgi:predicted nucleotide-binding protein (sugar kinase/HSP70/actin superfamily)